ncbi:MAG: DEAD/DEAH box helicase [Ardenticatenaceae bacterium]|nr:DEAD/DEAH box helicase [Ardenticatenaceae bacterium]MCB8988814.1 DEAD/DEAH box helicase [Ardenticatenaceae bacterium]
MDVFNLRHQLIDDYSTYISSFINIKDDRIQQHVQNELQAGILWPDPLIQLNPTFEPGAWIDDLVQSNVLHPVCQKIFRLKTDGHKPDSKPLRLHKHQTDAIAAAQSGDNYVLTTGTGSGKSLAYIVPIVDHVLKRGSGKGLQAIVIYPMNALANSQFNELEKFLGRGFDKPPVTFRRYTGQESSEERQKIIAHPPDILLTNYVMLELVMTRPFERDLIKAAKGLQFLVLDELHTYRGRQGADVAMLVRRVRNVCDSPNMQVVGTSATLAEGGTFTEQQDKIAAVATQLFGAPVKPQRIIGETLRRATADQALDDSAFIQALTQRLQSEALPAAAYDTFIADPLAVWIETTFGLENEPGNGRLRRAQPLSITGENGAASRLSALTGAPLDSCTRAIQQTLLAGYHAIHPETGFPAFAFRLHQFISRGDTVHASLEDPSARYITLKGQQYVPDNTRERILLPLAFCRECGQEYYVVNRRHDPHTHALIFVARELRDQTKEEDQQRGFLYRNPADPWPSDDEAIFERLPEDWIELTNAGLLRVKRHYRSKVPQTVRLNSLGQETEDGAKYNFIQSPFPFCLHCGVAYSGRERSDFGKLATLSSEGRSTATTVLSLSALRALRRDKTLEKKAKKLLSFTDNRQDASLQAGHFNDFVEVGLLRAALYRAVQQAGSSGIRHDELALKVFAALDLPTELYAVNPDVKFKQKQETEQALREVLAYRVYQDLRRGWRVTAPNLEQAGLLRIDYVSLRDLCVADAEWQNCHPALATATPEERYNVARVLLDVLRRELAIKVDYLDPTYQERIQQRSSLRLVEPWAIDEDEAMLHAAVAWPRSSRKGDYGGHLFISSRSGFGLYLRRQNTFPGYAANLKMTDTDHIIPQLFAVLAVAGLVEPVVESKTLGEPHGYQLPADGLMWLAGDGRSPFYDPVRMPRLPKTGLRTNPFFVDFYTEVATGLQDTQAREHTAQVSMEDRLEREARFRSAALPILYCSPTMELGVDISQLNVVNMRNVPPTPANYAQRSGRAGRSGQPALVFTYCTTGSPHDQYFFTQPERMVAGSVTPPRLDLANEDLVRSHVHAVWLAETGMSLGSSLKEILDLAGDPPSLTLLPSIQDGIDNTYARQVATKRLQAILATVETELQSADWYSEEWLPKVLQQLGDQFVRACDRWKSLYLAALQQQAAQHAIMKDATRTQSEKNIANRLRAEAEAQLKLLTDNRNVIQSDFYSYRYFASEGFLPGYNFPRLPLSAYLPGRRGKRRDQDEFLSRPRFLAIAEFGPRSVIYHEGSRYIINKVILPVGDEDVLTTHAQLCPSCGYLHPAQDGGLDLCQQCGQPLDMPLNNLFRMQNVATKRRDRINSDEEERTRMGYEIKTGVRFNAHGQDAGFRVAAVKGVDDSPLLKLTYGDAATLWRMNLGWRRRDSNTPNGFMLDTERGYWQKNEQDLDPDSEDPTSPMQQRVVPFVEDTRNCLLIEPLFAVDTETMASLQPALKTAVQLLYQLEDNELAAEPLPTLDERRLILLYESAEGGAGVLRQLLDDNTAVSRVAAKALELCHFDLAGVDLRRAERAKEDCEAACYDCLMSYYNQMDHRLLDRHLIRDILLQLAGSVVASSPTAVSPAAHLADLKAYCDSDLEREWLDFLDQHNLRLPDTAQKFIESCHTKPDFWYGDSYTAVYIDGPVHDHADIQQKDTAAADCLEQNLGVTVVRFHYLADWLNIVKQHPAIFGKVGE